MIKVLPKSFPPDPVQKPAPSLSATIADHTGPLELCNKLCNPQVINTQSDAGSKVGNEKRKEAPGMIDEPCWHPDRCLLSLHF